MNILDSMCIENFKTHLPGSCHALVHAGVKTHVLVQTARSVSGESAAVKEKEGGQYLLLWWKNDVRSEIPVQLEVEDVHTLPIPALDAGGAKDAETS